MQTEGNSMKSLLASVMQIFYTIANALNGKEIRWQIYFTICQEVITEYLKRNKNRSDKETVLISCLWW